MPKVSADNRLASRRRSHLSDEERLSQESHSESNWRAVGALSSVGLSLVIAIVIGVALGTWIDGQLGTKPWGFFVFFLLGLTAGILNVYRATRQFMK